MTGSGDKETGAGRSNHQFGGFEMGDQPRFAKAHSQLVADEYRRLGWTLVKEFRAAPGLEPCEYLLEWKQQRPPAYINWEEFGRKNNNVE